ncbi:MAG: endopeptidase La [Paludibacteraceae bacterium]|nr:endopeptidase La [Paludibacteraceae bacterium]
MIYSLNLDAINDDSLEEQAIPLIEGNDAAHPFRINTGDVLNVLPLRNMVLFPGVLLPVAVSRPKSQKLVINAYEQEKILAVVCQKEKDVQDPTAEDLFQLGTAARIVQVVELDNAGIMVILEGLERIYIEEFTTTRQNVIKARVQVLNEVFPRRGDKEFLAICSNIKDQAINVIRKSDKTPPEAGITLRNIDNPPTLVNYICVNFGFKIDEKQQLLAYETIHERAFHLLELLNKESQMLQMKADIQSKTQEDLDKEQREYYLQRQIETIQKELGDTGAQVIKEMKAKAEKKKWSKDVKKVFDEEIVKLQRMSTHSPEYSVQLEYLEVLLGLPWNEYSEDNFDIKHAKQVLDDDHYGLEKVKERILEYLAVQKQLATRNHAGKTPILCLYGPPGVGKTSLGKSVAKALGRKYARISLGGLHDEAEIRGHRRTYIGAMPGRIIENIQKVQTSNPVFVLDEIDKIGADYKGDPTSALLEVLDPEQNKAFHDNFLNVDYDLSKVLFIATANTLDSIPRPLLDRMELIEMTGYLMEEKAEIAKHHLVPKELEEHGLKGSQLRFNKDILFQMIDDYTRESGVRSLERQIATICRKVVTKIALEEDYNVAVTKEDLITYLGQKRFSRDQYENNKYIGVVTGLAWTQVGGEILFIETSLSPAKQPTLTLTGNLGDVMKESATLALGYIKAHSEQLGIKRKDMDTQSVHVHVPEGAIPKDGPSAGITMTTAMVSAFTKRKVRPRIAMTGEMTLRGKVLPIGGVKEKILAAKRAGITDLILCEDNRKDVLEIPEMYLSGLTFHYVADIQDVLNFALL